MPLLQLCETLFPLCVCAEAEKGVPAGKLAAPGISVAVCAKPSLLVNAIALPTATVMLGGAYPPDVPAGVWDAE